MKYKNFADDTKVFNQVGDENGIKQLPNDLKNLYQWSNEWLMLFNIKNSKLCT